jgi:hypothetical protein
VKGPNTPPQCLYGKLLSNKRHIYGIFFIDGKRALVGSNLNYPYFGVQGKYIVFVLKMKHFG